MRCFFFVIIRKSKRAIGWFWEVNIWVKSHGWIDHQTSKTF